jgi:hypothetical protein
MTSDTKLTPDHLRRRAVVYVRQSSEGQVLHHRESQHLQYALADRAHALGFRDVEIIDSDLGRSAAVAATRRAGFERLLGAARSVKSASSSVVSSPGSSAPTATSANSSSCASCSPR